MPPSAARSRMATDVGSSHWSPKVIVPRHSRDTCEPGAAEADVTHGAGYRFGPRPMG